MLNRPRDMTLRASGSIDLSTALKVPKISPSRPLDQGLRGWKGQIGNCLAAAQGKAAECNKTDLARRQGPHRSKAETEDQARLQIHLRGYVGYLNHRRQRCPPIAVPIGNVWATIDNRIPRLRPIRQIDLM